MASDNAEHEIAKRGDPFGFPRDHPFNSALFKTRQNVRNSEHGTTDSTGSAIAYFGPLLLLISHHIIPYTESTPAANSRVSAFRLFLLAFGLPNLQVMRV